ncbi:Beta-1,3-galactosyltransferase brn-like Protein [Tribolium castaneum]|uniref:Hexosyltransferase n=2 Tax=Tribolium castaneum TaxID=7070 RepID=D6WJI2_TRICA|nr:Beta-1,3-galactosyltransferase brn-like Protein [Tribolium castaneum]
MLTARKIKTLAYGACFLTVLYYFGVFTHLFESEFKHHFRYPYDGDIEELVQQLRSNATPKVPPINTYNFRFAKSSSNKCKNVENLRLVFLVKSAPEHFDRRLAIRSSWGFEHRFSDVEIRTVFLLGERSDATSQLKIRKEFESYKDIVQANFTDDYYNNTYKTMMGFTWAARFCPNARFYMFVDDDYYVSTKNLLRFIRNPTAYPNYLEPAKQRKLHQYDFDLDVNVRLYAGFVFVSAPHRHRTSKWYVSLSEYPYDMWPPYVTAGAYVVSREALLDMYYASFYTKHFKFDDIYVGLLAYKCKIEPYHCDQFYFNKLGYNFEDYKYLVATHGYGDPFELVKVWTQQRAKNSA